MDKLILLYSADVEGVHHPPGAELMVHGKSASELVQDGKARWPASGKLAPPSERDATILAACETAPWDEDGPRVLLTPRAPLLIGREFRGAGAEARLPAALADLLIEADEAVELVAPAQGTLGPLGLRMPHADGERLGDFMADAIDGDALALRLSGPPERSTWKGPDDWQGGAIPARAARAKPEMTRDHAEPLPPLLLAKARALAAGHWPHSGESVHGANAHHYPDLRALALRSWGLRRPDILTCPEIARVRLDRELLAAAERQYLAVVRQPFGPLRRIGLRAELFKALRSGAVVARAFRAGDPKRAVETINSGWWDDDTMHCAWKPGGGELRPGDESHAAAPHFRDVTLYPAASVVATTGALPSVGEDDEGARRSRRGGRPQKWDRVKIGNALRRIANTPDGLPDTAAAQRGLVLRICMEEWGEEPAGSTLADIMRDLDLR